MNVLTLMEPVCKMTFTWWIFSSVDSRILVFLFVFVTLCIMLRSLLLLPFTCFLLVFIIKIITSRTEQIVTDSNSYMPLGKCMHERHM